MARQLDTLYVESFWDGADYRVNMRGRISESADPELASDWYYQTVPADGVGDGTTNSAFRSLYIAKAQTAGKLP